MKPMWECQHDWWIEDFKFNLKQIWELKLLLRKHPDMGDKMGEAFRSMIKHIKNRIEFDLKEYEKIYGDKPNLRKLREEVENTKPAANK